MIDGRPGRGRRSAWIAGLTVGVGAGVLSLELPPIGWGLAVAFVVGALISKRRLAAIGGLVTGVGTAWTALLGRVALTCQATGDELGCHAPGIEPWLAAGLGILAVGLALTAALVARGRSG